MFDVRFEIVYNGEGKPTLCITSYGQGVVYITEKMDIDMIVTTIKSLIQFLKEKGV